MKNDILFVPMTSHKFVSTRQKWQVETFLYRCNYIYASDEDADNAIKCSSSDDYNSHLEKQKNAMCWLLEDCYSYYMFLDDDTFANVDNLYKILPELSRHGYLFEERSTPYLSSPVWEKYSNFRYLSGGAGMVFSYDVLSDIVEQIHLNNHDEKWSDVNIGLWMEDACIIPVHCPGFWYDNPTRLGHSEEFQSKQITYHYMVT